MTFEKYVGCLCTMCTEASSDIFLEAFQAPEVPHPYTVWGHDGASIPPWFCRNQCSYIYAVWVSVRYEGKFTGIAEKGGGLNFRPFQGINEKKWVKIFTFAYSQGRGGWPPPPPLAVSLIVKYPFFTTSLWEAFKYCFSDFFCKRGAPPLPGGKFRENNHFLQPSLTWRKRN